MSLLLIAPNRDMHPWKEALQNIDPNIDVDIWPDIKNKNRVQFAVIWNQPAYVLKRFPNLKAISSLGTGVDHIFRDDSIPKIAYQKAFLSVGSSLLHYYDRCMNMY